MKVEPVMTILDVFPIFDNQKRVIDTGTALVGVYKVDTGRENFFVSVATSEANPEELIKFGFSAKTAKQIENTISITNAHQHLAGYLLFILAKTEAVIYPNEILFIEHYSGRYDVCMFTGIEKRIMEEECLPVFCFSKPVWYPLCTTKRKEPFKKVLEENIDKIEKYFQIWKEKAGEMLL